MRILGRLISVGILTIAAIRPAFAASDLLTRGEVYRLVNQAQLLPFNRPARRAVLRDAMVPQDAIKTAARSRAELLFNEGSVARIGSNALFRFIPGMRGFQLRNGTALIISLPNAAATRIEALEGQVVAEIPAIDPTLSPPSPDVSPDNPQFLAYYQKTGVLTILADASKNQVEFFNSGIVPISLKGADGQVRILPPGTTVTFLNGTFSNVQVFNLRRFLDTSQLMQGLGIGQEAVLLQESLPVQRSLRAARVATLAALNLQAKQLEGLCTLNARGGASTLNTNCITTDSDDPLRRFQDRRDIVTPRPEQTPPIDVEVPTPPQTPPPQTPPPQTPPPQTPPPQTPPTAVPVLIQGGN